MSRLEDPSPHNIIYFPAYLSMLFDGIALLIIINVNVINMSNFEHKQPIQNKY